MSAAPCFGQVLWNTSRRAYIHNNSYTGQCPLYLWWCGTRRERRRWRSSTEVWADEGWLEER
jgi:hypothetical protein